MTDTENHDPADRSSRLFDLRLIIGGIFTVYGIVLVITGLADNSAEVDKAAGIRINLWVGIGMLIVGAIFLAWARLRPVRIEDQSAAAQADGPPQ